MVEHGAVAGLDDVAQHRGEGRVRARGGHERAVEVVAAGERGDQNLRRCMADDAVPVPDGARRDALRGDSALVAGAQIIDDLDAALAEHGQVGGGSPCRAGPVL